MILCLQVQLDLTRVTEELRSEQEHAQNAERRCKQFETQIKELTIRIEDGGSSDSRISRRNVERLEVRIRELENVSIFKK